MLTYTPPDARPPAKTHEKPWLLLLMAFAWLWPGVFSHDLWNPAEPAVYTAVEALAGSPTPLVAHLFGQTDFGIPPVYLWVAAAFKHLLSPWAADPYDAARFAGVFFAVIGLTSCGFAGFNFLGRHHGRSVVLIHIGCIGLIPVAHFLNPAAAAFAAAGLVLHGYSLARRRVIAAFFLLGTGWTLMSLAAAYPAAFALMLPLPVLMFFRPWQSRRLMLTAVASLAFALPLMTVYPLLLAKTQPALFAQWLNYHVFGTFGGVRHIQTAFSLFYYLKNLLWFALPALPLAVWTVCRTRLFSTDWGILGIVWMLAVLVLLAFNPQRFQDNLRLAAAAACPVRRGATGQPEARRGGFCQLVRHYGVRAVCRVPVDGLFRHELRLARQACRTRRLLQPVLRSRHRSHSDGGCRTVHTLVAVGDYPEKHTRQAGGYQLGGRRYPDLGFADDAVPAVAGRGEKPRARRPEYGGIVFPGIKTGAFRRHRVYRHRRRRPAHADCLDAVRHIAAPRRRCPLPLPYRPPAPKRGCAARLADGLAGCAPAQQRQ